MAIFEDSTCKNNRKNGNGRQRPPQYFARKSGKRVYEDDLDNLSTDGLNDLYKEVQSTLDSMTAQRDKAEDWDDEPDWFYPLKVKIRCASYFRDILRELIGDLVEVSLGEYFMQVASEELQGSEYEYFLKEAERRQKGEPAGV